MRHLKIGWAITNRESASLDKYLVEIGRVELVTAEEEVELAMRIKNGDKAALEKLVLANLRFVVSIAKQYQNQGVTLPDLINEGNLGLIRAAEKFDETRGFKFISYSVWWIRQSMLEAIATQAKTVRVPLNQIGILNKINKAGSRFELINERKPSPDELSEILDIEVSKIEDALATSKKTVSLDSTFGDSEDLTLLDILPNPKSLPVDHFLISESLSNEIERKIDLYLTEREADILRMFFGIGRQEMTYEEIGERFSLTRERVRQIKEKAIRKLRHPYRSKTLKEYLG